METINIPKLKLLSFFFYTYRFEYMPIKWPTEYSNSPSLFFKNIGEYCLEGNTLHPLPPPCYILLLSPLMSAGKFKTCSMGEF